MLLNILLSYLKITVEKLFLEATVTRALMSWHQCVMIHDITSGFHYGGESLTVAATPQSGCHSFSFGGSMRVFKGKRTGMATGLQGSKNTRRRRQPCSPASHFRCCPGHALYLHIPRYASIYLGMRKMSQSPGGKDGFWYHIYVQTTSHICSERQWIHTHGATRGMGKWSLLVNWKYTKLYLMTGTAGFNDILVAHFWSSVKESKGFWSSVKQSSIKGSPHGENLSMDWTGWRKIVALPAYDLD